MGKRARGAFTPSPCLQARPGAPAVSRPQPRPTRCRPPSATALVLRPPCLPGVGGRRATSQPGDQGQALDHRHACTHTGIHMCCVRAHTHTCTDGHTHSAPTHPAAIPDVRTRKQSQDRRVFGAGGPPAPSQPCSTHSAGSWDKLEEGVGAPQGGERGAVRAQPPLPRARSPAPAPWEAVGWGAGPLPASRPREGGSRWTGPRTPEQASPEAARGRGEGRPPVLSQLSTCGPAGSVSKGGWETGRRQGSWGRQSPRTLGEPGHGQRRPKLARLLPSVPLGQGTAVV